MQQQYEGHWTRQYKNNMGPFKIINTQTKHTKNKNQQKTTKNNNPKKRKPKPTGPRRIYAHV